jgi:FKBP-type peptidyl-prolyl cis-trans isomerase SlyD
MTTEISPAMQIERDRVVRFHYRLSDADDTFNETSEGGEPVTYLHGHGGIVHGLEKEMRGRQSGDTFQARVPPEFAYGYRDESLKQRVPIKHLIRPGKLAVGKLVAVNTSQGTQRGRVVKLGRFNVDLDFNHLLAGKTLIFDIEIVEVREGTAEEIQHRHVHGPGGHEH